MIANNTNNNSNNGHTNGNGNTSNNNSSNVHLAKQIRTDHHDLIQDIAYDFFGKRVATASLDQLVKIWNINDNNEWEFKEDIKVMPGLYKVAWAHPEFGQLIAVAHDRLVWLFEELCHGNNKNSQCGWTKRVPAFSDARATITDIKFAPKLLGLQLIATTSNGEARIYECIDTTTCGSTAWTLQQEIKINMESCSSCSWSTCLNLPVLLAFGCDSSQSQSKLAIFEYNDSSRTYSKIDVPSTICQDPIRSIAFAPSVGKLFHTLAVGSKALYVVTIKPIKDNHKYQISSVTLDTDVSTWRVCWNTVGSVLASAGDDRHVRLWKCNYMGEWKCFAEIIGDTCQTRIDSALHEHNFIQQPQTPNFFHNPQSQFNVTQQKQQHPQQQQQQSQQNHHNHHYQQQQPQQQQNQQNNVNYHNQTSITSSGISMNSNSTTAASSLFANSHHYDNYSFHHPNYPHQQQQHQHHHHHQQQQQQQHHQQQIDQNTKFYKAGSISTQLTNPNEVIWH